MCSVVRIFPFFISLLPTIDLTELTLEGDNKTNLEILVRKFAYANLRDFPTPGRRPLRVYTNIVYVFYFIFFVTASLYISYLVAHKGNRSSDCRLLKYAKLIEMFSSSSSFVR